MEPNTLLDHALFQLTPTRTRCDLVIFSGKKHEKIATGLLQPYISHVKSAQDQISKGGYSINLKPPSDNSPWFTKSTLQRFVRFVSTPELLERFVTIERELDQIETSNGTSDQFHGNASSTDGDLQSKPDTELEETPKVRLHRVLESRKVMLKKEQAMAYARALVAGFETDSLYELVSFSDAFGAQRLREACVNFVELCNKKRQDKIWMDEVEKVQASYMGSPQVSLAAGSMDISEGTTNALQKELDSQQTEGVNPLLTWPQNHPHYMLHSQAPVFQPYPPGYVFPGMPWPANFHNPGPPLDSSIKESPRKNKSRRKKEKHEDMEDEDISDDTENSSSRSNSSNEKVNKNKHKKKSSRKVVIRNINYVASSRNEKDSNGSESYSSDEQLKMKNSIKSKKGIRISKDALDAENEGNLVTSGEEKKDGNWDIFQNLLMREPDSNSVDIGSKSMQIQEEYDDPKPKMGSKFASDDFLFTERSTGNGFGEEEHYPQKANFSTEHSVLKTRQEEDFIVSTKSEIRNANIDDHDIFSGDQASANVNTSIQEKKKVVFSDDSFMVQSRVSDSPELTQPMHDDIFMVTDIVGSNQSRNNNVPGNSNSYEPEDLKMMLGHDPVTEETVVSWSHDMETTVTSHVKSKPSDDTVVKEAKQQLGNGKVSKTGANKDSGRKTAGKESKPKAPSGSLSRSKSDIPPRSKLSTSGSTINRSKSETEEEKRKKMEELSKQRQKRIAERSAAKGVVTPEASKRSAKEVKKTSFIPSKEKPRASINQDSKKSDKPVMMRSSTINRLASSRTTNKPSLGQNKKPTPSAKVTKGTQKQHKVIKANPSDKKNGSKNDKSKMISSEKSEQSPTESGIVLDSAKVKVLDSVSSFEKRGSVDSISGNANGGDGEVVQTTPHEIKVSPTDEKLGGDKKRLTFSPDVSVLEISSSTTPPPELEDEMNLEHSRKKWNNGESSPKIPKGLRRLLLFGRRT